MRVFDFTRDDVLILFYLFHVILTIFYVHNNTLIIKVKYKLKFICFVCYYSLRMFY